MHDRSSVTDIATHPGVDFPVAERLNIKAISPPGLPGKVAPNTPKFYVKYIQINCLI